MHDQKNKPKNTDKNQRKGVVEIVSFTRQYKVDEEPELVFILRRTDGEREALAGLIKNRADKARAGIVRPGLALAELAGMIPAHPMRMRSDNGGNSHSAPVRFALAFPEHRELIEGAYPAAAEVVAAELEKRTRVQASATGKQPASPRGSFKKPEAPARPRPAAFDEAARSVAAPADDYQRPLVTKTPIRNLDAARGKGV